MLMTVLSSEAQGRGTASAKQGRCECQALTRHLPRTQAMGVSDPASPQGQGNRSESAEPLGNLSQAVSPPSIYHCLH